MREQKVKLNANMTIKTKRTIEGLEARLNASSLSEVITKAVNILDVVTSEQEKGNSVAIYNEKKKTKRDIIIL